MARSGYVVGDSLMNDCVLVTVSWSFTESEGQLRYIGPKFMRHLSRALEIFYYEIHVLGSNHFSSLFTLSFSLFLAVPILFLTLSIHIPD